MAPKKILAIKLRSMGDTVLMTAPLLELIGAFPQAEIHALVTDTWAPILAGIHGIHQIWNYKRPEKTAARLRFLGSLALQLRKEQYDCVINFHASPSSAKLAFATGAKTRAIHFHGHRDKNLYSTVEIPGKGTIKPIIERDMDTLRALGVHVPAGRSPLVALQSAETEEARKFIEKLNFLTPVLGISLGASRPSKCWPIERFAALAIDWCQNEKGSVLAFAGPTEGSEIQTFMKTVDDILVATFEDQKARAQVRSRIAATNGLPLRKLAAVLSQMAVLAGNDSGPKHLAIAVETPTVTLFGPEHPFEWHPYPQERHPYHFVEPLSCRKDADPGMPAWCGIHECIVEEHKCMRQIGIDSVLANCQRVAKR